MTRTIKASHLWPGMILAERPDLGRIYAVNLSPSGKVGLTWAIGKHVYEVALEPHDTLDIVEEIEQ